MAKLNSLKPVAAAVVASALSMAAQADTNPFAVKPVGAGLAVAENQEGKCGAKGAAEGKAAEEGKCGGEMAEKMEKAKKEGKCGEGKCGSKMKEKMKEKMKAEKEGSKMEEGKCGGMKMPADTKPADAASDAKAKK